MHEPKPTQTLSRPRDDQSAYVIQAIGSVAAVLLLTGIFFYTQRQFGWGLSRNLMLASGQGAFYVAGALAAGRVIARLGRRRTLLILESAMTATGLLCLAVPTSAAVTACLLIYSMLSAVQWPVLESWVSTGGPANPVEHAEWLSRRLTRYNLVWSFMNALTLAGSGAIIEWWPSGMFVLAAVCNAVAGLLVYWHADDIVAAEHSETHDTIAVEPELEATRTETLWLSRIALPSSYVVAYSLAAMMPSLAVLRPLATVWRTLVGSTWFIARWLIFAVLGRTVFWHTRPRLMLAATALMLIALLGTALRPTDFCPALHEPFAIDLSLMILWQILLGAAMGVIYAASLYFGMVLSQGSTEHGGYHEALIGLGSTLGPAAAAAVFEIHPGVASSAVTVAAIIGISLAVASFVSITSRRRRPG